MEVIIDKAFEYMKENPDKAVYALAMVGVAAVGYGGMKLADRISEFNFKMDINMKCNPQ